MEWKTIDSAPFNVDILMYAPDCYRKHNQYVGYKWSIDYKPGFAVSLSGSDCQTGCGDTGNPTHWKSLDPPPEEA
jgi:hypothetical protein